MNFVSIEFLFLVIAVWALYRISGHRAQNYLLLSASLIFYGWWDWRFLGLLFASTLIDYLCAIAIDPARGMRQERRKGLLVASVVLNLTILGVFKYYNFFVENLTVAATSVGINLSVGFMDVVLPIGISFYTFHAMSYMIDVYKGIVRPTRNYENYMLYILFFPQLAAGPIARATHLLPQMENDRTVDRSRTVSGIYLASWGFFKKAVIADNTGAIADYVFGSGSGTGAAIAVGSYAFALQIYCDFSGYTDIARGISRMFGVELSENFRLPYFTWNPREFWHRWHMSLSTWIRDYLYIPLGGGRGNWFFRFKNLSISMLLCGLWHGASWHFVVWGAYWGTMLGGYSLLAETSKGKRLEAAIEQGGIRRWLATLVFFQVVVFGWLIFRVESLDQLARATTALTSDWRWQLADTELATKVAILAVPLIAMEILQYHRGLEPWLTWSTATKAGFVALAGISVLLLDPPVRSAFIYFQF